VLAAMLRSCMPGSGLERDIQSIQLLRHVSGFVDFAEADWPLIRNLRWSTIQHPREAASCMRDHSLGNYIV
jgi:hypothetical protein